MANLVLLFHASGESGPPLGVVAMNAAGEWYYEIWPPSGEIIRCEANFHSRAWATEALIDELTKRGLLS